jgi:hypothetical protein
MKKLNPRTTNTLLTLVLAAGMLPPASHAEFSLPSGSTSPGHGISNVLSGRIANGALYWRSTTNWVNSTPAKPYAVTNDYALPVCDSISVARIVATIWGGTPNYVSEFSVTINGTNLPGASPLIFGTTADANPVFSPASANAYGSGSGVWLISLPVPATLLFTNGAINTIVVSQNTTNGFDGRVQHVTLLAVYQRAALNNTFDYAIAEGSGDLYKTPGGTQVAQRTVTFASVNPTNATAAKLNVLYTYGDALNDRLDFNGTQIGGDNVAQFDTSVVNNGPSVLSFDVLASLVAANTVTFSLGADVPTPETSLRPQLAALTVTRPPQTAPPALSVTAAVVVAWPVSGDNYQLEYRPNADSGAWTAVTNLPTILNGQKEVILPRTSPQQFYQLRKTN